MAMSTSFTAAGLAFPSLPRPACLRAKPLVAGPCLPESAAPTTFSHAHHVLRNDHVPDGVTELSLRHGASCYE